MTDAFMNTTSLSNVREGEMLLLMSVHVRDGRGELLGLHICLLMKILYISNVKCIKGLWHILHSDDQTPKKDGIDIRPTPRLLQRA